MKQTEFKKAIAKVNSEIIGAYQNYLTAYGLEQISADDLYYELSDSDDPKKSAIKAFWDLIEALEDIESIDCLPEKMAALDFNQWIAKEAETNESFIGDEIIEEATDSGVCLYVDFEQTIATKEGRIIGRFVGTLGGSIEDLSAPNRVEYHSAYDIEGMPLLMAGTYQIPEELLIDYVELPEPETGYFDFLREKYFNERGETMDNKTPLFEAETFDSDLGNWDSKLYLIDLVVAWGKLEAVYVLRLSHQNSALDITVRMTAELGSIEDLERTFDWSYPELTIHNFGLERETDLGLNIYSDHEDIVSFVDIQRFINELMNPACWALHSELSESWKAEQSIKHLRSFLSADNNSLVADQLNTLEALVKMSKAPIVQPLPEFKIGGQSNEQ